MTVARPLLHNQNAGQEMPVRVEEATMPMAKRKPAPISSIQSKATKERRAQHKAKQGSAARAATKAAHGAERRRGRDEGDEGFDAAGMLRPPDDS
jgi:hypothetical protein